RQHHHQRAGRPGTRRSRRELWGGPSQLCRSQRAGGHDQVQFPAPDPIRLPVFPGWDRHDCYQHHEHRVLMHASWLRKQSGQAVVLVAVAVVVLTAILALALDGGGIYLDRRQIQNAADSAALAGAELLMAIPPSYPGIHNQAIGNLPYAVVALQDKPANSQYHNLNFSASTAVLGLQGGGGPSARGGVFSNAGIDPGNGIPAITFSPAGNAGDLWAVNEPNGDQSLLNAAGRVTGQQTAGTLPRLASHLDLPSYPEPAPPAASFNGSTVANG